MIYVLYKEEDRSSSRGPAPERYEDEEEDGEYSDADDFIVDDEGRPIADKRKKRKPIFTDAWVLMFVNLKWLILYMCDIYGKKYKFQLLLSSLSQNL